MTLERQVELLESEWMPEDGFFWRIRQGSFSVAEFERALKKISDVPIANKDELPRRMVSLLWFIPTFMQYQVERIRESDGDMSAYESAMAAMVEELMRLLGVP